MFKALFGKNDEDEGVEIGTFENDDEQVSNRKCTLRIINTQIIYDNDECIFYTLATCVNEINEIETVSLEGFIIDENVSNLEGSYIDYEEYEEYGEDYTKGRIYRREVY